MAERVTCLKGARTVVYAPGRSLISCPGPLHLNSSSGCSVNIPHRQSIRTSLRSETHKLRGRTRNQLRESRVCTKYWTTSSFPFFVDVGSFSCKASKGRTVLAVRRLKVDSDKEVQDESVGEEEDVEAGPRAVVQAALWFLAGGYVVWLFILPNAPGDPVWAISPDTISMLIDLSLNFFYVLPILNAGGVHVMESPIVHPTAEALFNLVLGWTVMFAPLLFTDRKRDRFKGPLELWWIFQMFLTNTFLIPYMAIRLNASEEKQKEPSPTLNEVSRKSLHFPKLSSAMTSGAHIVAATGSVIGVLTVLWFILGRGEFGSLADRWNFFLSYVSTDRVGYAFIWDLALYSAFQPWLIGDNLSNLEKDKVELVSKLRFVPYIGLIAYLWGLPRNRKL